MILLVLFILIFSVSAQAQPDFEEDWESGYAGHGVKWDENGGCYNYSFKVVDDPCDSGNKVMRITNIMGDDNSNCSPPWDGDASGSCPEANCYPKRHRAEMEPSDTSLRPDNGEDHWVGFRIFLPTDWPQVDPPGEAQTCTQMIPPPFSGFDWNIYCNYPDFQHNSRDQAAVHFVNTTLGTLNLGEWNNIVSHYRRATDSSGRVEVWLNGSKIVDRTGRTSQSTDAGGRWKISNYRGRIVGTSWAGLTYVNYFDDIKVAYGANEFDTVNPSRAPGCSPTPPPSTYEINQRSHRFYEKFLGEGVKPLSAEGTVFNTYASGFATLRFSVNAEGSDSPASRDLTLWGRKCNPTCGSWTAITTSTADAIGIYIVDHPSRSNRVATVNKLSLGGFTYQSQGLFVDADNDAVPTLLDEDKVTEIEYSIGVSSSASNGDVVELRLQESNGDPLDMYLTTPKVVIGNARSVSEGGISP